MGNTTAPKTLAAISTTAAKASVALAACVLVLLAALHFLKPDVDPSWRMVSEYANGDHGWIMRVVFVSWSLSNLALFLAIRSQAQTLAGRIGLGFLLAAAVGMGMAALFSVDPSTVTREQMTTQGRLHGFAFMIGVPSLPIAAVLISRSLRRNVLWAPARQTLAWVAHLPWVSLIVMVAVIGVGLAGGGKFGPKMLVGWPNRFLVAAYCAWVLTVAYRALQLGGRRSQGATLEPADALSRAV
jgi:hypothetical protein